MRALQANKFEIGFPEGWTDHSVVTIVGPERPQFSPNVSVHQEPRPADTTVEAYLGEQRAELAQLEGFQLLEKGDRVVGGMAAQFHSYRWRIPQGVDIRQTQLMFERGATVYTITLSARADEWELFEPHFELLLARFRFTGV